MKTYNIVLLIELYSHRWYFHRTTVTTETWHIHYSRLQASISSVWEKSWQKDSSMNSWKNQSMPVRVRLCFIGMNEKTRLISAGTNSSVISRFTSCALNLCELNRWKEASRLLCNVIDWIGFLKKVNFLAHRRFNLRTMWG